MRSPPALDTTASAAPLPTTWLVPLAFVAFAFALGGCNSDRACQQIEASYLGMEGRCVDVQPSMDYNYGEAFARYVAPGDHCGRAIRGVGRVNAMKPVEMFEMFSPWEGYEQPPPAWWTPSSTLSRSDTMLRTNQERIRCKEEGGVVYLTYNHW